jgi:hypothetical protein
MADMGDATITGVPLAGLPKITSTVSRMSSPACRASARWSITANRRIPLALMIPVSRATASATESGLVLVTMSAGTAAEEPSVIGSPSDLSH